MDQSQKLLKVILVVNILILILISVITWKIFRSVDVIDSELPPGLPLGPVELGSCGDGTCDAVESNLGVCPQDCKK